MSKDSRTQEPRLDDTVIIIDCAGLYRDEIEKVQRLLDRSRYAFKVTEVASSQTESVGRSISFLQLETRLTISFSLKLFRTQRGAVDAIVKAVDETLSESAHEQNREPKVLYRPNGEIVVKIQESTRPRSKKQSWSKTDKLTAGGLILAALIGVSAFFVPEVRQFFHLEKKPKPIETQTTPVKSEQAPVIPNHEPSKPEPTKFKKPLNTQQAAAAHIKGNGNVAGNNVTGKNNVTGNDNQKVPSAVAPNGIAIAGGNVTNPTVNNFAPPPPKPAVVTVCVGEPQNVVIDVGHDGEIKLILTLTTESPVENPTYGFQFSGTILSKGSSASSPDMAINIKEGVTTPTSFAFVLYQTWYPGQRMNVEIHSHDVLRFINAVGKHSESFNIKNGNCNSGL